MCMLCRGIPVEFYLQKVGAYIQEEGDKRKRSRGNAKAFCGIDDETFEKLMENDQFNDLVTKHLLER